MVRGQARKMNDIAKLTQGKYVRSISNPSHLKPFSKKVALIRVIFYFGVVQAMPLKNLSCTTLRLFFADLAENTSLKYSPCEEIVVQTSNFICC